MLTDANLSQIFTNTSMLEMFYIKDYKSFLLNYKHVADLIDFFARWLEKIVNNPLLYNTRVHKTI